MATEPKRSQIAEQRNVTAQMTPTIYEQRAAGAVRTLISGPHADKHTARAFGCSVRLAQHLRQGRCWTIKRLTQASAVLGCAFDTLLTPSSSAEHYAEMADIRGIAERLARLENAYATLAGEDTARLAPAAGQEALLAGRGIRAGRDGLPEDSREPRAESQTLPTGIRAPRREVAPPAAGRSGR